MVRKVKDKRQKIPLSKYTRGGRISSLIAGLAIVILVAAICVSVSKRGNAGIIVGILGLLTFALGVLGFAIGIQSFKEETKFLRYSWSGTLANLVIWLVMLMMFLIYR